MEKINWVILFALVTQINCANSASIDSESLNIINPMLSSEKSDPVKPAAIPLKSTSLLASQQRNAAADTSTSEKCSSTLSDAQKRFRKIATESFPEFIQFLSDELKNDNDLKGDCLNSKGEFPTKVENDIILKHQWAIEYFKLP